MLVSENTNKMFLAQKKVSFLMTILRSIMHQSLSFSNKSRGVLHDYFYSVYDNSESAVTMKFLSLQPAHALPFFSLFNTPLQLYLTAKCSDTFVSHLVKCPCIFLRPSWMRKNGGKKSLTFALISLLFLWRSSC